MDLNLLTYEEFKLYNKYFKGAKSVEEIDNCIEELKNSGPLEEGKMDTLGYIAKKLKDAFLKIKGKKKKK